MDEDLKKLRGEVREVRTLYQQEATKFAELQQELKEWLAAGNSLRKSVVAAARNLEKTRERLVRFERRFDEFIDLREDPADWWKK